MGTHDRGKGKAAQNGLFLCHSSRITYVEGSEAVPAEDMLAALAHHLERSHEGSDEAVYLGTPGVPLYWHTAHRTPLDIVIIGVRPGKGIGHLSSPLHYGGPVFSAGQAGVPGGTAQATELLVTAWAGDGHPLGLGAGADVADGVTACGGAPGARRIHRHLGVEAEGAVLVEELLVGEPLHLVLGEDALGRALGVRARDVVRPLHDLEGDVLLHALQLRSEFSYSQYILTYKIDQ